MTIDKVAELSHVSRSVVSRVLNDHPNVSDAARERVLEVIEKYDYRPNSVARSLATNRTHEVCVLAPRRKEDALANGLWPLLHSGILERSLDRGYVASLSMLAAETQDVISEQLVNGQRFDGYILLTQEVSDCVVPALGDRDVPIVLIGHNPNHPELSSVDVDNYDGVHKATSHLCDLGHERIAAIWGHAGIKESADRRAGYRDALREAGRDVAEAWMAVGDYSQESGYEIMRRWLDEGFEPTALFCASDTMAMGALLALHQAGVAVPQEVAVVGFDDLPTSAYTFPPLTTVRQPIYEEGEQAAGLLIDQIEADDPVVMHVDLDPELVVRESCGARL